MTAITDEELATRAMFTVGTEELRRILKAVAPHAHPDVHISALHRVRFELIGNTLRLVATNAYTAALAELSVTNGYGDTDHPKPWDLSPLDVKKLLGIFDGKSASTVQGEEQVRVDVNGKYVTVTDTSGLFEGESLQLVRYADEPKYPPVAAVIGRTMRLGSTDVDRLVTDGARMSLFTRTASALGQPLVLQPSGARGTLVVTCGEHFIGLLMPMRVDEQKEANLTNYLAAWWRELPDDPSAPTSVDWGVYGTDSREVGEEDGDAEDGEDGDAEEVEGQEELPVGDEPAPERPPLQLVRPADPFAAPAADNGEEQEEEGKDPAGDDDMQELLLHAAEKVVRTQLASGAMLERTLRVGHRKAARILDELTRLNVTGPSRGKNARHVLVAPDDLELALGAVREDEPLPQQAQADDESEPEPDGDPQP